MSRPDPHPGVRGEEHRTPLFLAPLLVPAPQREDRGDVGRLQRLRCGRSWLSRFDHSDAASLTGHLWGSPALSGTPLTEYSPGHGFRSVWVSQNPLRSCLQWHASSSYPCRSVLALQIAILGGDQPDTRAHLPSMASTGALGYGAQTVPQQPPLHPGIPFWVSAALGPCGQGEEGG